MVFYIVLCTTYSVIIIGFLKIINFIYLFRTLVFGMP